MPSHSDFRLTWLWRHAFVNPFPGVTEAEQEFFRDSYLAMREKASALVSQIAAAMPGLTVHDVTHLDALWETASLVSDGAITVSPAEAFVFGASVLLHDSAMSLAAYPQGLSDLKQTIAWKDTVVALLRDGEYDASVVNDPPQDVAQRAIPEVLRQLHAQRAATLASQGWETANGDTVYLIDDPDLRFFYGETIGQIAHSHWWSVARVEELLSEDLGALPTRTGSRIDRVKLACLLRIADALHLDQRRAPRFLRALTRPQGASAMHWSFQERLATPHIEHEAVVFTAGAPFQISDADAWWLAYDTMSAVNRELQEVDLLMQNRARGLFRARRVKGAGSPESLARTVRTQGWRPIDTQLRVSDIPRVVETLGGAKLYGDDPTIVLRELIQNSADAVQARRRHQSRREDWGNIVVSLSEKPDGHWLAVEDNGIGMSERVLTGPLIDFGTSFWRSSLATQEFPGLIAKGMNAIGRYGIGFFSVFMLGTTVRVISRRCDQGEEATRILEFRDGTASRPILSPAEQGRAPVDGGTRVEIKLKINPREKGGLLHVARYGETILTLNQLVGSLAPSVAVSVEVEESGTSAPAIGSGDWLQLPDHALLSRLDPLANSEASQKLRKSGQHTAIRTIVGDNGRALGRAYIRPGDYFRNDGGWVTIGGLRAVRLSNVEGLLVGETVVASRNSAMPLVSRDHLAAWATEQARIIAASKSDELYKAKCAEVVLECGGSLEGLPIVCRGSDEWLNSAEFSELLASLSDVVVTFSGDFTYDEDNDDVHPRDFKNDLEISENILVVPRHDGSVLTVGRQAWPRSITGQPMRLETNLAAEFRRLLEIVWEGDVQEESMNYAIGKVNGTPIIRDMTIFLRYTKANTFE